MYGEGEVYGSITVAAAQYRSCSSCPARSAAAAAVAAGRSRPGAGRATSDSVGAPPCVHLWLTD